MYEIHRSNKFKKSFKRICRSGSFDNGYFEKILLLLVNKQELPGQLHDHRLKGNYSGFRECHIKGDCLLIYYFDDSEKVLYLVNIGNHANLFE